jgi:hypothetical protein
LLENVQTSLTSLVTFCLQKQLKEKAMSELLQPSQEKVQIDAETSRPLGRITVLEALAEKIDVVSPTLSWQSAWSNKEDR